MSTEFQETGRRWMCFWAERRGTESISTGDFACASGLAKKQQLICSRETPKGSGIGHARCLWRCTCRAELKTELVAILHLDSIFLHQVTSNLLINSPSPCSQATACPLHLSPTSMPDRWLPRERVDLQRPGKADGEVREPECKWAHLLVRPLSTLPQLAPRRLGIPLPGDDGSLSGNQLHWLSDTQTR